MRVPGSVGPSGEREWNVLHHADILPGMRHVSVKSPEQEARAIAEREANRKAKERGLPLPFPNMWDFLDPTKLDPREATPEKIAERYREFCKLCPPRRRKVHTP